MESRETEAFITQQRRLNDARRDTLLCEVAALERAMGYGGRGRPTTKQLRAWFQHTGGYCASCGKPQLNHEECSS
jgi:hypothetical protein